MRIVVATVAACLLFTAPAAAAQFNVMIATWRGCEEACQGFQDYLTEKGVDAAFILRDADQKKEILPDILAEARAEQVDLILSWGTTVTRGIAGTLSELGDAAFNHDIPQVFTIVADPVGAGIIESLDSTGRPNVTGTYNRVPEDVNIQTIRAYLPDFEHLGLMYSASEKNSVLKRDEIAGLSKELGFAFTAVELPAGGDGEPRIEDIAPKVAELKAAGVDFIYLGSSSFLRENGGAVTGAAMQNGIPVLSPYESLVRDSEALISVAPRYYEVGRLAGEQAEKILVGGAQAGDLPVARMTNFAIVINMDVAKKLKRFPPIDLLQVAETVP
ncbi:ABC transporter substrate-binding protein [Microbaculum sp. FT89]|uniref:ABC transporter substrate-binding protein n=1 Tax=Microbaculum sp. FT89 TaxID=3447298 RepID=UPI003F534ADA